MPTRDEILSRASLRAVPFRCEWGDLYLLRCTGTERRAWDAFVRNMTDDITGMIRDTAEFRATLVQLSVCDKEGVLTFAPADVAKLLTMPADVQEIIAVAASKLNKLSAYAAAEEAKQGFFPEKN